MSTFEIRVGGIYTNASEIFARDVVSIDDGDVFYHSYGYPDGNPIGSGGCCSLGRFRSWAARPLSPSEADALREVGVPRRRARGRAMIRLFLDNLPDGMLLEAVRRRGQDQPKGE
jgi:hypothetical protein